MFEIWEEKPRGRRSRPPRLRRVARSHRPDWADLPFPSPLGQGSAGNRAARAQARERPPAAPNRTLCKIGSAGYGREALDPRSLTLLGPPILHNAMLGAAGFGGLRRWGPGHPIASSRLAPVVPRGRQGSGRARQAYAHLRFALAGTARLRSQPRIIFGGSLHRACCQRSRWSPVEGQGLARFADLVGGESVLDVGEDPLLGGAW